MVYINIQDFGAEAGTNTDNTLAVFLAIEKCKEYDEVTLVFPKGTYHFWPEQAFEKSYFISNHDADGLKKIAFPIINFNHITIDGQGSNFIFHGIMIPFVIENSTNVVIKNINIDWEKPFYSQGKIIAVDTHCIEIEMCKEVSYRIENKKMILTGEGWEYEPWGLMEFDSNTKAPAYGSWDNPLGMLSNNIIFEEGFDRKVKLLGYFTRMPEVNNQLLLRHGNRNGAGIFIKDSQEVFLENISIYYVNGMGVIAQKSQNINLYRVDVKLRPGSERIFTAFADATHFVNCRGLIHISECLFENQLDDATNVHGIYTVVAKILSTKTILAKLMHPQHKGVEICSEGDKIAFVDNKTLLTYEYGIVENMKKINQEYFIISFKNLLPRGLSENHVTENVTWMPELIIKNCIARSNRARGFLVTTPKKVLIEGNFFNVPGSAIKISGDANSWFESGQVKDLTIQGNQFIDCNYVYGPWGKAVIDIDPEIDEFEEGLCYHKNIWIKDNLFQTFSPALIKGHSVDNLIFANNTIHPTTTYPQNENKDYAIDLAYSQNVIIEENVYNQEQQIKVNGETSKMK